MADTKIEWADKVWNPVVGCTKCSPGCLNCYAERMANRLRCMGIYPYHDHPDLEPITKQGWTGLITCNEKSLDQPLRWPKPCRIFVCSMSDLFHPKVPIGFQIGVYETITDDKSQHHTFLILTKRPKIMADFHQQEVVGAFFHQQEVVGALPNVHLGVSISNQKEADEKIPILLQIPAAVRFLSIEPLLEAIDLKLNWPRKDCKGTISSTCTQLHGVIVGGESGPGARPMHPDWARNIRDQCATAGIPFYFKQWGAYTPDGPADVMNNDVVFLKDGTMMKTKDVFRGGWQKYYDSPTDCVWMKRVGKKRASRLLDGRLYNQLPAAERGQRR